MNLKNMHIFEKGLHSKQTKTAPGSVEVRPIRLRHKTMMMTC